MEVLAIQNGTEVYTSQTGMDITYYDEIESDSTGQWYTRFTAKGNVGEEIGWLYIINDDGSYGSKFEQAATAAPGKFAYASATKMTKTE